jgi:hypothetical protein
VHKESNHTALNLENKERKSKTDCNSNINQRFRRPILSAIKAEITNGKKETTNCIIKSLFRISQISSCLA